MVQPAFGRREIRYYRPLWRQVSSYADAYVRRVCVRARARSGERGWCEDPAADDGRWKHDDVRLYLEPRVGSRATGADPVGD